MEMSNEKIKQIALENGFKCKTTNAQGEPDLHEYVYQFARALLAANVNDESGGTMKVVINTSIGGFRLSHETLVAYLTKKGKTFRFVPLGIEIYGVEVLSEDGEYYYELSEYEIERNDPLLIEAVEECKDPRLKIVEIPAGVEFEICERDDGVESIHEVHRIWY